jgi:hypothetical protein
MFAKANVGWQVIVCLAVVSGVTGCVSQEQAAGEQTRADLYRQISVLESERQALADKMQQQRDSFKRVSGDGGAGDLDSRVEMRMQRVAASQRIGLGSSPGNCQIRYPTQTYFSSFRVSL